MGLQRSSLAMTAVLALLSACATSDDIRSADQRNRCPHDEILVCEGGAVSKVGRLSEREPRICQCRPPDQLTF